MYEKVLKEQNPHWHSKPSGTWLKRTQFQQLLKLLPAPHVISIAGVRRSGKSTLIKQLIEHLITVDKVKPENILFLNLEHPFFMNYNQDIENLHNCYLEYLKLKNPQGKIYILLDEIQFFEDWPVFVKALYEQKECKFIITGSNSALIKGDLMTLLSGRCVPIEMYPLSYNEFLNHAKLTPKSPTHQLQHQLEHYLKLGGFPDIVLTADESVAKELLQAHAKSILLQDVVSRLKLKRALELERLFYYLITDVTSPYSFSKLAKLFHISDKTVKDYIDAICESHLLFQLEQFSYSLKSQMRAPKKPYCIDVGIINSVAFQFSENRGKLLENIIFLELKRRKFEIYYYKTKNDLEVDFLIKRGSEYQLIQVACSLEDAKTRKREINALKAAAKEMKVTKQLIITENDKETIDDIEIIPAFEFLSMVD